MIDDADDDDAKDYKSIAKKLGSDPKLVVQVDSETNEDDPTLDHMIEISITYSITNFGLLDNLSISATETGTIVVSDM
jgi:hypothetical protein